MPDSSTDSAPATPPLPITCDTAVRRLWDYIDGGLAATARAEVDAHLAACAKCPPHFAFSARARATLAAARPPAEEDDAELRERVLAALRAAI